jgi:ATP-binding cassette subfamily B protein
VRGLSRTAQDRVADSSGMAGETLNAIQTVQAFTMEEFQGSRFGAAVQASFAAAILRARAGALLTAVSVLALFGAITFVLWIGAHAVLNGEITGGQLGQFLLYAMFVAASAASLTEVWGEVQRAAGAMERLMELLKAEPKITVPTHPVPMPARREGSIRFDKASFSYPSRPGVQALHDFSLTVTPGERVAFVGPSGAGKTTTFQLLLRFYDLSAGRILVDGVDIALANPEDVRARIGIVPQESVIFGATARENIRFGRPAARSKRRPGLPQQTTSFAHCRRATTPSSANVARDCPAVSASASRSPAPFSRIRRFCCWMRRRARWMPRTSGWCRKHSSFSRRTARPSSLRIAWQPCCRLIASW